MIRGLVTVVSSSLLLLACQKAEGPSAHKAPPPARIEGARSESEGALVTLTPKAVERLGIETATMNRRAVGRRRELPAEVVLPPGASVTVAAPVAGRVSSSAGRSLPAVLDRLAAGDEVLRLEPLLTPERQVLTRPERLSAATARANLAILALDAETEVAALRVRVDAAGKVLDRARTLLSDDVGSRRRVDEAKAEHDVAASRLEGARRKVALLREIDLDEDAGTPGPLTIVAPLTGLLVERLVADGQLVVAGERLFRLLDDRTTWIAVRAYAGELDRLDLTAAAQVTPLAAATPATPWSAVPVTGPPGADHRAATVKLFYRLEGAPPGLQPGQRLVASIKTRETNEALVAPWSAVLLDFDGGTWVYRAETDVSFRRQRVWVRRRDGDLAVLDAGPDAGVRVVTAGAAEIFGTELGTGK